MIFNLMKPVPTTESATMYSYNGTVLPALPEWDKETYPYAYISYGFGEFILFLFSKEGFIKKSITTINGTEYESKVLATESGQDPYMTYDCYSNGDFSTDSDQWNYSYSSEYGSNGKVAPLWCNTDLYYMDGTLFLEATDPVPVYE